MSTGHVRWPQPTASYPTRHTAAAPTPTPRWPRSRERPATQIQSASDDRRRQSGHPGYGGHDRSTARQSAVSRAARRVESTDATARSEKQPPIVAMARRTSFARCKANRRDLHSAVERPRGEQQVPEGRVGLRARTRSLSLSGGEVSDSQSRHLRKPQAITSSPPETAAIVRWRRLARRSETTITSHQRLVKSESSTKTCSRRYWLTCKNRLSSNERPSGCGSARGCSPSRSNTTASRERSTAGVPKCRSRPTCAQLCRTSSAFSSHFIAGC